jgi:hypothetical protein
MLFNKIKIVSDQEAETDADFIVCVLATDPLMLPDNRINVCCKCFRAIQHRPHVPVMPKKVCFECIKDDLEREAKTGTVDWIMTPQIAIEFADYIRHKKNN